MALVLTKANQRDIKQGHAKVLRCANCNTEVFYGAMRLVALGIADHKPVCGYECNRALGQVK